MLRSCSFSLLAAIAAGLLLPGLSLGGKAHPRIHHAVFELREARSELKAAKHDFGGHRKAALKEVNAAITQLEKALKHSGDKRPFKGDPKAGVSRKYATYPHIRHIAIVRNCGKPFQRTEGGFSHDYGGHREQALVVTQAAIKQLELCIRFANRKQ